MTIYEALSQVMEAVQTVRKNERNDQQGFNFRGIDAVVNAVGPALRNAGVVVSPDVREYKYGSVEIGRNRTPMAHVQLIASFTFYAQDGTSLTATAPGEAMDSGDKATPKAMSVAYRTALLQALCIPTDDPDPDSQVYERSAPPEQVSSEVRDAIRTLGGKHQVADLRGFVIDTIGRPVTALSDLTIDEGSAVMARLIGMDSFTPAATGEPEGLAPAPADVAAQQAEIRDLAAERERLREDRPAPRASSRPPAKLSSEQRGRVMAEFTRLQILNREERLEYTSVVVGRQIASTSDLTGAEAHKLIDHLISIDNPIAAAAAIAPDGAIDVSTDPD